MDLHVITALLCIGCLQNISAYQASVNNTMELLNDLLQNYDRRVRPTTIQSKPVEVNLTFDMRMLRGFDDVSGEITFLGVFTFEWYEERFQWNPRDYAGIDEVILPKNEIWHPEVIAPNSIETTNQPGKTASKIMIHSDGKAEMLSLDLITSSCPVDVTKYPHDTQTCNIDIMPLGYSQKQMVLQPGGSDSQTLTSSSEWEIMNITVNAIPGKFTIEITVRRHFLYAVITMKIPIFLLGVLNPWVFFLPPESGERASYSITTFLAFTVYMGTVTENVPQGSMPLANVTYQVFIMLIYSVVILLCTIISLQIHTNEGVKPVPRLVQSVVNFLNCSWKRCKQESSTVSTTSIMTGEEKHSSLRRQEKRSTLQRLSSGYITAVDLPAVYEEEKREAFVNKDDERAKKKDEMRWVYVGNVFDIYMFLAFKVWFVVVLIYFGV